MLQVLKPKILTIVLTIVNIICCAAFLWQLSSVIYGWLVPTHSFVKSEERPMREFAFPLIIKICLNPGFNLHALNEEGYEFISRYFLGESMYNSSVYGWAGHSNDSDNRKRSVKGYCKRYKTSWDCVRVTAQLEFRLS